MRYWLLSYPVNPLLHEVQQHLNDGHVLPTIFLWPGLSGDVDENVQARRGNVAQKINSMAAMGITREDSKTFKTQQRISKAAQDQWIQISTLKLGTDLLTFSVSYPSQ